jgi:hypothetical protein
VAYPGIQFKMIVEKDQQACKNGRENKNPLVGFVEIPPDIPDYYLHPPEK